jgi:hypothetical protein
MPTATGNSRPTTAWPNRRRSAGTALAAVLGVIARLVEPVRVPAAAADELLEARELLAYWEGRLRGLPRWALLRRREARATAARWRDRVRAAEQLRYGRGWTGAASQLALEGRMPTRVAHRGRQAARVAVYGAVTVALTFALVLLAAVITVVETILTAF